MVQGDRDWSGDAVALKEEILAAGRALCAAGMSPDEASGLVWRTVRKRAVPPEILRAVVLLLELSAAAGDGRGTGRGR